MIESTTTSNSTHSAPLGQFQLEGESCSSATDRESTGLSFEHLADVESGLRTLAIEAASFPAPRCQTQKWRAWRSFKRRVDALTGWSAAHPILQCNHARDLVYDRILELFEG